jgi:hypothetical protein
MNEDLILIKQLLEKITEDEFVRITNGERVNDIGIPYSRDYLDQLILNYELKEEYEKCSVIQNYIKEYLSDKKHKELYDKY